MIYLTFLHLTLLEFALSSTVLDYIDQNDIDMSGYCQETESCAEGTHVACMYYEPNRSMGAQCVNSNEVTISKSTKYSILREINSIRSKLALGLETGKYGLPLPKAYGMHKVFWDNELALFAQIWANQCKTKKDLCRSTSRFPNPRQIIAEVRFSYPKWQRQDRGRTRRTGVAQDNVLYSLMAAIETWYGLKAYVDDTMIDGKTYEQWEKFIPNDYLALIHGPTTHMGCGVSAFTKQIYHRNMLRVYNIILVVCNFATQPKSGQSMYSLQNMNPERSSCGCPDGTEEDTDCLCIKTPEKLENFPDQSYTKKSCIGGNCRRNLMISSLATKSNPSDLMKLILRVKEIEKPITLFLMNELANITHISKPEEVYKYMADPNRLQEYKGGVHMRRPIKAIIAPPDFEDLSTDRTDTEHEKFSKTSPQTRFRIRNQPKGEFKKLPSVVQNMDAKFFRSVQFNPSETRKKNLALEQLDSNQDVNYSSIENLVKIYAKYKKENNLIKRKADNDFEKLIRATKSQNKQAVNFKTNSKITDFKKNNKISIDQKEQPNIETVDLTDAENYTRIISLLNFLEKGIKDMHFNETGRKIIDERIKNIYNKISLPTEVITHNNSPQSTFKEVETNFKLKPILNRRSQSFDSKVNKYIHGFKNKPKQLSPNLDKYSTIISFEDLMKEFNDNQDLQDKVSGEFNILSEYFKGNLAKDFNIHLNPNTSMSNNFYSFKKYDSNSAKDNTYYGKDKVKIRLNNGQNLDRRRFSQTDFNPIDEISKSSETLGDSHESFEDLKSDRMKTFSKYLNKH